MAALGRRLLVGSRMGGLDWIDGCSSTRTLPPTGNRASRQVRSAPKTSTTIRLPSPALQPHRLAVFAPPLGLLTHPASGKKDRDSIQFDRLYFCRCCCRWRWWGINHQAMFISLPLLRLNLVPCGLWGTCMYSRDDGRVEIMQSAHVGPTDRPTDPDGGVDAR
ncbi:hypothetical protein EX30DRAFT_259131 [Ascodesmis nigricans]|uniref:Uncharacterized protein n=1 Tax=Ascodesmis nigricans TaxID=341454 RepID=A0A4S2MXH8_9PEZI|nr:hypothetical protein EX30DRAFT_259131 [Ascodesmis nigricans]